MKIPPYLIPIYNIIKSSFGSEINEFQYQGLIALLYDHMSNRNIGLLLSLFINKDHTIITADVDKYHSVDLLEYNNIKEQLNRNGFIKWACSFDFQVNNSFIKNDILYVEGRFIEGQIIKIGDEIHSLRTTDKIEAVHMKIVSIEMYNRQLDFIDIGMTGRLGLETNQLYKLDNDIILSSESI